MAGQQNRLAEAGAPLMRDRGDRGTTDLFSWEPPQVAVGYDADVAGRGELAHQIARLVSRALRDARDDHNLSRAAVAETISATLGRAVSTDTLDKWSSEAAEGHRIPLDAFVALIRATGAVELCGFVPSLFGLVVVDEKYEAIIELSLLEEHEREVAAYKARLSSRLRGGR